MKNKLIMLWIILVLVSGCLQATNNSQLPNPASVYCNEKGGTLDIRTNLDGSQSGYCMFESGSECEEWAFYKGECEI